MNIRPLRTFLFLAAACVGSASYAQTASPVVVDGSWARATVQGQRSSGAFMRLTAPEATRLVRVETPAAGVAEVHEMKMEGDVMKMRAVPVLDLPAGKTVELKSGGYHVMLTDLKAPLVKGASMPLTLVFKDANGVEHPQTVQVPVAVSAPGGADHKMQGMDHGAMDANAGAAHKH